MKTAPGVDVDLGWALGSVVRSYLRTATEALNGVPGGLRGYLVLKISSRGEPSSQLALAQHLGVDRTVMTYLLDDLEQAGLVERRPDPVDRRARRVVLTADGRTVLEGAKDRLHAAEDDLLQPLDAGERAVLRSLLHRLATSMAPANPCEMIRDIVTHGTEAVGPPRRRRRPTS